MPVLFERFAVKKTEHIFLLNKCKYKNKLILLRVLSNLMHQSNENQTLKIVLITTHEIFII